MADVPEKSVQFAGAGQPSNAQTTPEPGQQGAGEQQAEQGNKYLTARRRSAYSMTYSIGVRRAYRKDENRVAR
jgi:hypothetical protein